jgi:uncharacterized membrane protein
MNSTYIHLLLNHFPIIGTLAGVGIILFGVIVKDMRVQNIALSIFVICSFIAIPVFLTGEPAEETVESLPGVTEVAIEKHEEAAQFSIWLMATLGILSTLSLIANVKEHSSSARLTLATAIFSIATFGSMAYTGKLGGEIRHIEIADGNAQQGGGENEEGANGEEGDD